MWLAADEVWGNVGRWVTGFLHCGACDSSTSLPSAPSLRTISFVPAGVGRGCLEGVGGRCKDLPANIDTGTGHSAVKNTCALQYNLPSTALTKQIFIPSICAVLNRKTTDVASTFFRSFSDVEAHVQGSKRRYEGNRVATQHPMCHVRDLCRSAGMRCREHPNQHPHRWRFPPWPRCAPHMHAAAFPSLCNNTVFWFIAM